MIDKGVAIAASAAAAAALCLYSEASSGDECSLKLFDFLQYFRVGIWLLLLLLGPVNRRSTPAPVVL